MSQRWRRTERGAAAVEMAIILPLLVLILGGIIDFGRAFFTQVMLTNAAREGARAAVVLADPVCRAQAAVGANACGSTAGIYVSGWQAPGVTFVPSTATSCSAATSVTVTTSATFNFFFVGVIPGVPATTTLQSKATMGCL